MVDTWSEIISSWPVGAVHEMEQPPGYVHGNWTVLCSVSQIALDRWYANISPGEICGETTFKSDIMIWQQRRMDASQLDKVKKLKKEAIVSILTIDETNVVVHKGSLGDILEKFSDLVMQAQLQTLRIFVGMGLGGLRKGLLYEKPECKRRFVYFLTTGPVLSMVKAFEGDSNFRLDTLADGSCSWTFCKKPKEKEEIQVPDSLKSMWLRTQFKPAIVQDFLSEHFYQLSMSSYAAWSYSLHRAQVREALQGLTSDYTVVAPGDGIGVVHDLCSGRVPVVSGDSVKAQFTSSGVLQESFLETMMRGRACQKPVLVLSYVYSLMTEEERMYVRDWDCPVFVIDSRDTLPDTGFEHLGPGLYGRAIPKSWPVGMKKVEGPVGHEMVLYSENLLSLPSIFHERENPSVVYWKRMRPFANSNDLEAPVVVHDLQELVDLGYVDPQETVIYLASIGQIYVGADQISIPLKATFQERIVYQIHRSSPYVKVLKNRAQYAFTEDQFLFVFPLSSKFPTGGIIAEEGIETKFQFSIVKQAKQVRPYDLRAKVGQRLVVQTPSGIVYWNMSCPFNKYLIFMYFSVFGRPGWKLLLTGSLDAQKFFDLSDYFPPDGYLYRLPDKNCYVPKILFQMRGEELTPREGASPLLWEVKSGGSFLSKFVLSLTKVNRGSFKRLMVFFSSMDVLFSSS